MAAKKPNIFEIDVDKSFQDHSIDEMVSLCALLDIEINNKHVELRSMVSLRYKDILAASDGIANIKMLSKKLIDTINSIYSTWPVIIAENRIETSNMNIADSQKEDSIKYEQRVLAAQVRLLLWLTEEIWIELDKKNSLKATELFLFAQHIHLGIYLANNKYLNNVQFLNEIKDTLNFIRECILEYINKRLAAVDLAPKEASINLNAFMLLKNVDVSSLVQVFLGYRQNALEAILKQSSISIRTQVCDMVKCIMTTIQLLHDCFICNDRTAGSSLMLQQWEEVLGDSSQCSLFKFGLPESPLIMYIPEVVRKFTVDRKYCSTYSVTKEVVDQWLENTEKLIETNLAQIFKVITNVKGLYWIQHEVTKIEFHELWDNLCQKVNLPKNFNVWSHFFQPLLTARAEKLITKRIAFILEEFQKNISTVLTQLSNDSEINTLKISMWCQKHNDYCAKDSIHEEFSMKSQGYCRYVIDSCKNFDRDCENLLIDISQYLWNYEWTKDRINKNRIVVNPGQVEKSLIQKFKQTTSTLISFVEMAVNHDPKQTQTLFCARLLKGIPALCPHFVYCCSLKDEHSWKTESKWFSDTCLKIWDVWIDTSVSQSKRIVSEALKISDLYDILSILTRWDSIEIKEQDDETIIKSNVKVPLKPSLPLSKILTYVNAQISQILPHTFPKSVHTKYMNKHVETIFKGYEEMLTNYEFNENQALQFLFDIKFLTTFCVSRDNVEQMAHSQKICKQLRNKIDPFDLDVFYPYLQNNIKKAVFQSHSLLGCLVPSMHQEISLTSLSTNLGQQDYEKEPSLMPLITPSSSFWFLLLPVTAPSYSNIMKTAFEDNENEKFTNENMENMSTKSSGLTLFGNFTTDWFSK